MPSFWENSVIAAYRQYLVYALPATVVAIKVLVRVIAREPRKDVWRSLLVLPLDFVYIAMGVLLTAAAKRDATLMSHYDSEGSADMAVVLQVISLVICAIVITVCDRWNRVLYQKFYAAWALFGEKRKEAAQATEGAAGQMNLKLNSVNGPTLTRESGILLAWIMFYWTGMVPLEMAQVTLGLFCLSSILARLR
jgi:hypothetical protein